MSTTHVLVLVLLTSCSQLSFDKSASAGPTPTAPSSSRSEKPAERSGRAHDKLGVLDVKIGMPLEVPGYTCTKDKRTASGEREERHCVKFVDERCQGRQTNIGVKKYGAKAPMGCFHDTSSATFLDDVLMQDPHTGASDQAHNGRTPLANVHLVGTESTPSKIYRISYTVAWDDLLNESSKLHKALVAKYGEPTEIHGWMRWKVETTKLEARCESNYCVIDVEDRKFEENVEHEQDEADAKQKRDTAPPPQL